ncbi:pyridoxamine 5'-phosphate oxidase family protein [Pseudonocardia endophytica]|uniref:Pyridoxamine 5'-phosphate oxidase n=1 Tax=Pseudonocardia endophytica TaxID=401976 RepID=A0A4R1HIK0_PSEEN|nr:pyridoxamine 5'-phosphate oxidase family protein [Pseudonocardia endophytica]TCK22114.1 pyridoxamine 5'-phosphate oxidase [Pseudonocardia endophytica]
MSTDQDASGSAAGPGRLGDRERELFLAEPHVAIVSVADDGGRPPATVPTWYAYEPGGTITLVTRQGKRKSRLIRGAGALSLSVQRAQVPYRYATVEGTVVRQQPAERDDLVVVLRRYLPHDAVDSWVEWELRGGNGNGPPEVVEIRPDRWLTGDFGG